ncbi:phosphate starvation-inducible protein PhoH [Caldicellulosiruptor bescii]|uniref:PhoH-like protein n=2 Tax=Caldicellulosiruptor bescii TaxID=31899 RepID=B9MRR8_CALBD|nr:PhoH family protein [Caldicellulosiruptor bescii]ACM60372.1 PhoH family protein [Caldicellulosiruptor bescii DSM 6725]PBC87786.1 phosphate starvation-inducible protein PhoH [Caldicellulosiruptor bescii]PBC90718.1 phosphate starvation-inducible protein PhoH [Caldicellulosiruptor bescii]PBD03849.1 phosphate starvation-inducible protein PhoH [Caldicellulosiruptor bescii]PBD06516.1 phosphate starvation-inducible protein PhoH [Caldicellulosiruptor bescii]
MEERLISTLSIEDTQELWNIFGEFDSKVKTLEELLNVNIVFRDNGIKIIGNNPENISKAEKTIKILHDMEKKKLDIDEHTIRYIVETLEDEEIRSLENDVIFITHRGKQVKPKTLGQKRYINAIMNNTIVFGIGPAGTGKTYLAMAMAVHYLKKKEVSKIILTRPAVEAGEKLGFLPGDLQTKVDPYLRPIYDALHDLIGTETYQRYMERGVIEVAPLAYMRGRTLDDAFIILDEAQNTTSEQMKMFLTRLGFGSKAVVTGDITQIDLPSGIESGLVQVTKILRDIEGIEFVFLTYQDVVRHQLVQKIINAYNRYEEKRKEKQRA